MGVPHEIVPVILVGGGVTGLRPLAGQHRPPPFLRLYDKRSLFQDAVLRGALFSKPVIVCSEKLKDPVRKQLMEIGITPAAIIVEPYGKGTAAAVALAAFHIQNQGKIMLVMPSDQIIPDHGIFQKNVMACSEEAGDGLVLLGVEAQYPDVSYGYIRQGVAHRGASSQVSAFYEKPDVKRAQALASDPRVLWNTGIFMARPRHYLSELQIYAGDIYRFAQRSYFAAKNNGDIVYPQAEEFDKMPAMSVECAVMEKSTTLFVYDLKMRWGDVGTWKKFLRLKIANAL